MMGKACTLVLLISIVHVFRKCMQLQIIIAALVCVCLHVSNWTV